MAVASVASVVAGGSAAAITGPPCDIGGQACVVVQVLDASGQVGPLHYVHGDDVGGPGADVVDKNYPVPGGSGVQVVKGSSVSRIVGEFVDVSQVHYVEVDGASTDFYGRHQLTATELGPPGSNGFQGNLAPALYEDSNSDVMNYVRPLRSAGDDQRTAGPDFGLFFSPPDGSILLTVHLAGQPVDVHVTATPTDGTDRTFTLSTTPTGGGYSFAWYFPSGPGSTDPTPIYGFPTNAVAGTYPITVGVTDTSDGSFGWGTAQVQIGPAPTPSPSPSASPGPGGNGSASAGPTKQPSGSPTGHPNPHPTPGSGGTATSSPTTTPTATATATPEPTTAPSASASTGPTAPPSPTPTPTAPADGGDQAGPEVTGVLLTSSEQGGSSTTVSDVPQASAAARPIARPPLQVDPLVWGGAVGVLLLLAGAASESEALRRRLGRWLKMGP